MIARSYRLALAFDIAFGLVSLLVYFFISRTFRSAATAELSGAPTYFSFAAVGVALNLVIQAASARVAQRFREEQLTGTLETLVAQPITAAETSLGLSAFHFAFAMVRTALYVAIAGAWLDLDVSQADWAGFVLVLVAAGFAMTAVGVALASLVLIIRRAEVLVGLTTLALGLLGGAFFPISVLPDWLHPIAEVLPTRFAFDGVRAALFGGGDWGDELVSLLVFSLVALPVAVAFFKATLDAACRRGSLTSY